MVTLLKPETGTVQTVDNQSSLAGALVQQGVLSEAQLERALRIRSILEEPQSLLQVLVELGDVSEENLASAVELYGKSLHIGDVLLEQGLINEATLAAALECQEKSGEHLGKILIDMGEINERIMLRNVARQRHVPYIEPSFPMIDLGLFECASPAFLERNSLVPFSVDTHGKVTVVVNDLDDTDAQQAAADLFQDNITFALGPSDAIAQTLDDFARFREKTLPGDSAQYLENSVIEQVDHIVQSAIIERASDIHIEPMHDRTRLRYRIDGVMVYKTDLPKDLHSRLVSRIKIMAEIEIADHHHHQGGRILFTYKGVEYDLRVSIYVTVNGENIVIRVLNKELGLVSFKELGMSPGLQKTFKREVLDVPSGIILITAPTGEGKTTTLYSCLDYSNNEAVKIITAEDPVEYSLEGVIQCAIHEKAGRTFATTLREIVRQDPDIVVLGEIRDVPTAEFAIEAALTGHKVYSTFHTEDSIAALLRLMEMGIEPFLISSSLRAVLAQRLLRRICRACETVEIPTMQICDELGIDPAEASRYEFKKGQGCSLCNFTGYRGRVAVFECLLLNEQLRTAVYQKKPADTLDHLAFETTDVLALREDALCKAAKGITTLSEIKRKTPPPFAIRPLHQIMRITG